MKEIIISILFPLLIILFFSLFYIVRQKEETKQSNDSEFSLKQTKGLFIFFLVWIIICFISIIILIIMNIIDPFLYASLVSLIIITIFMTLGFVGFISAKFDNLIVMEDRILENRGFKKTKTIMFSKIKYYQFNDSIMGGVCCYDKDGIPLLEISNYYIGVEKLARLLYRMNIETLPKPYPTEDMKKNENYQKYKKYSSYKGRIIISLIFIIMSLGLFALMFPQLSFEEYKNYEVNGIIKEVKIIDQTITIYLMNEDNIYYINSIVYDELDEKVLKELEKGKTIKLHIANIDKFDRLNISQIEIDKIIYLNMDDAEKAEYLNYKSGVITAYVFLGIGIILFIYFLINIFILKCFIKKNNLKCI